jgi:hypothetical protein
MDESQLRLDGNAAAGILREVFAMDVSGAREACASCGTIGSVGAQHLYMYPLAPGAVVRCSTCGDVLMVLVRGGGRYRLALPGLRWLEMREPVQAPLET